MGWTDRIPTEMEPDDLLVTQEGRILRRLPDGGMEDTGARRDMTPPPLPEPGFDLKGALLIAAPPICYMLAALSPFIILAIWT